jgi:dihydrofolate reductase
MRARCSVFVAASLDGFIARADGGIDWLSLVEQPGEDYGYKAFFDSVDTLVIGRKTYATARGFEPWPYGGKRCVVMTHGSPKALHGEEFTSEAASELVDRLTEEGAKRIYIDGATVIEQFLVAGLVTDVTLSIVPVLLGVGVRLFGRTDGDIRLELIESQRFPSGLLQAVYRVRIEPSESRDLLH